MELVYFYWSQIYIALYTPRLQAPSRGGQRDTQLSNEDISWNY